MTRVCGDVKNAWELCDEKGVLLSPPRMVRKLECVKEKGPRYSRGLSLSQNY